VFGIKQRRRQADLDVAHWVLIERVNRNLYELQNEYRSDAVLVAKLATTQEYLANAIEKVDRANAKGCPDQRQHRHDD
jgi:hypothetical protein